MFRVRALLFAAFVLTALAPTGAPAPEGPRDLSGAATTDDGEWGAYTRSWLAGEPWPVTTSSLYGALRAEPRDDAAEVGDIRDDVGAPVTVLEVLSVRVPGFYEPVMDNKVYEVWLKVRAGNVVGWNKTDIYPAPALVRFTQPAGPFRTAAAADAPAIEAVTPEEWGSLKPNPGAGELYGLLLWWNGWACVDGGWIPADTAGMEVYWSSASWSIEPDTFEFTFFFPVKGDVSRLYIKVFEYSKAGRASVNPAFTVVTAEGEIAAAVREAGADYGWESARTYYEVALPRPVARDDILAFTYAIGEGEGRVLMKLDPRPAWAGP